MSNTIKHTGKASKPHSYTMHQILQRLARMQQQGEALDDNGKMKQLVTALDFNELAHCVEAVKELTTICSYFAQMAENRTVPRDGPYTAGAIALGKKARHQMTRRIVTISEH
mgnify:FL=1|tara:strand:- start:87 stop:422 length:336 start_codon:yes stop_codon:yes gene_type:complete